MAVEDHRLYREWSDAFDRVVVAKIRLDTGPVCEKSLAQIDYDDARAKYEQLCDLLID